MPPNLLTLLGIIPSLLFFYCLVNHLYALALIAFIGNVIDMLDGAVARTHHKTSAFGAFFDSTLDRVVDFVSIVAFGFAGIVRWEIVLPVLLFSFLISYERSRGELASANRVSFDVGIVERPERLIIIFLSLLLFVLFPNFTIARLNSAEAIFSLLALLSFITVLQRFHHAYKKL